MCDISNKRVEVAAEIFKRKKLEVADVTSKGNKTVELRMQFNGKTYKRSVPIEVVREAYGNAMQNSGLMQ